MRLMRPADVFEPGYDTVNFTQPANCNSFKATTQKEGLTMSYKEACEAATK